MATESRTHFTAIVKRTKLTFTYVDLSVNDGKEVTEQFWGYHKGAGCPTPIVLELDNIDVEYEENYPTPIERDALSDTQFVAKARRANFLRLRDMLVAVVPGISAEAANVLVSPNDEGQSPGISALEFLGHRNPVVAQAEDSESTEGEVQRVDETGQLSSQTPTQSTQD